MGEEPARQRRGCEEAGLGPAVCLGRVGSPVQPEVRRTRAGRGAVGQDEIRRPPPCSSVCLSVCFPLPRAHSYGESLLRYRPNLHTVGRQRDCNPFTRCDRRKRNSRKGPDPLLPGLPPRSEKWPSQDTLSSFVMAGGPPSPPFWNLLPALPAPAPLQCGRVQCRSRRRSGDTGCRALSCQPPARPGRAPGPTRSSSWPPHGPAFFQLEAVLVLQLLLSGSLTLPRPGQTSWSGARCRQQCPRQASLRPRPFHGEGPRRA